MNKRSYQINPYGSGWRGLALAILKKAVDDYLSGNASDYDIKTFCESDMFAKLYKIAGADFYHQLVRERRRKAGESFEN